MSKMFEYITGHGGDVARLEALEHVLGLLSAELEDNAKNRAEIERLSMLRERMWCKACGAITRNDVCDCTREETGTQTLGNYADSMQEDARKLSQENEWLRDEKGCALLDMKDEVARLLAALSWIDTFDPETIAAAETKFGNLISGVEQKAPDVSYVCPDCGESIRLGFGHMPGCDKTVGRS